MRPTELRLAFASCSLILLTSGHLTTAVPAAMVTVRLGTGLSPTDTDGRLPQTWVAPTNKPPQIDGRLDEEVWSAARPVVLGELERGGETSPRTEVRLVHAGGVLYVGCRLAEPKMDQLKRTVSQRDGPAYQDDSVELFLSPHPARGYFQIIISATGAIFDRRDRGDPAAWNCDAKAAAVLGQSGWSLEVAVPMAALEVGQKVPARWRANIYRNRQAGPEGALQAFSPTFSGDYDVPKRFGQLLFTPEPPGTGEQARTGVLQGITVADFGDRGSVLLFDLSAIPKNARVHRARLLAQRGPYDGGSDDALKDLELYPLAAPYQEGRVPAAVGKPLELAGPGYRSFQVTEQVRRWIAGQGHPGLYVKVFPGWQKHATYLDVMYEGQPRDVPAQVKGVRAFHRAGQTFVTWRDPEDSFGERPVSWGELRDYLRDTGTRQQVLYRVYRHQRPIDAASVKDAVLLAEVAPLSGFNVNSWSRERLINQTVFSNEDQGELGVYGPFTGWTTDSSQGGKLVIPRLAIEDGKALAAGMGLYVNSAAARQEAYYAVTAVAGGVENLADFSAANSLAKPVAEIPATWEPVEQPSGGGFGFDFRGQRRFYVTWVAPPLAPRLMYFNWSVLVPPDSGEPCPAELYFHAPGYSYARPPVKFLDGSIQICPHDFPFSGWYGYTDAAGTLKNPADAAVQPYTIRRIEAFLKWAQGKFSIDASRIVAVGGDGAAIMALNRPELFAYVLITGFESQQLDPKAAGRYARAWGPASPKIKNTAGLSEWTWGELDYLLCGKRLPAVVRDGGPFPAAERSAPGLKTELPLFVCRSYSWGRNPDYGHGRGRFYYALQATRHPLHAHWAWGGNLTAPAKYSGLWQGLDIQNTTPVPAITNSSTDKEGEGSGQTNAGYTWRDVKEDADRFEITILGPESTFDLTPRRLSRLKVQPGQRFSWEAVCVETPHWNRVEQPEPKSGLVTADGNGLITLKASELVRGYALKVQLRKTN